MKNFADGINPNLARDPADRRHWKVTREALRELSRQLGAISTEGQNPSAIVITEADGLSSVAPVVDVFDNLFVIKDDVVPSRQAKFECANITTGVVRTVSFPDLTGDMGVVQRIQGSDLNASLFDSITVPSLGTYLVTSFLQVTTADGGASGNVQMEVTYNDQRNPPVGFTVPLGPALVLSVTGTPATDVRVFKANAGSIDFSATLSGTVGSAKYAVDFCVMRMGV